MPAKQPRITFTPTPESFALLKRMSRATGQPISGCARDMMATLEDHLDMLVHVLERARGLSQGAREAALAAATDAEIAMRPLLDEAEALMFKMVTALEEPPLPLLDARPPSSNTGVTEVRKGNKVPARKAA